MDGDAPNGSTRGATIGHTREDAGMARTECEDCPPGDQCKICVEMDQLIMRADALDWNRLLLALARIWDGSDAESRHSEADDLLCIALLNAAPTEGNTQGVLDKVVRFYLKVQPKWYA